MGESMLGGACLGYFIPELPSSFIRPLTFLGLEERLPTEGLGCRFLLRLTFQGWVWAVSVYSLFATLRLNLSSEVSSEKRIQLVY